jgi:hypothetical protein
VQTFRYELEQFVEQSVASVRHLNLLELQNTTTLAITRTFGKMTGAVGSACHWVAATLHYQSAWSANSVLVANLPPSTEPGELRQLFLSRGDIASDSIEIHKNSASIHFQLANGISRALEMDGAKLRGSVISVRPEVRAYPPSNPVAGTVYGLLLGLYYPYAGLRSLQPLQCALGLMKGCAAIVCQPIVGIFGYYDHLYACLGRLYPREPFRTSRKRMRASRTFGAHGSILPLRTGSSHDRDILQFVESLDECASHCPATVVHQTTNFALLTTRHALVYVRRQPTLQLEWSVYASCLLAYDVPTLLPKETILQRKRSPHLTQEPPRGMDTNHARNSVDLLCLRPINVPLYTRNRQQSKWGEAARLACLSVVVETEMQVGPLLRRLRTWWVCSRCMAVDDTGVDVTAWIHPGVALRVPQFEVHGNIRVSDVNQTLRRISEHTNSAKVASRSVRFHHLAYGGAPRFLRLSGTGETRQIP